MVGGILCTEAAFQIFSHIFYLVPMVESDKERLRTKFLKCCTTLDLSLIVLLLLIFFLATEFKFYVQLTRLRNPSLSASYFS